MSVPWWLCFSSCQFEWQVHHLLTKYHFKWFQGFQKYIQARLDLRNHIFYFLIGVMFDWRTMYVITNHFVSPEKSGFCLIFSCLKKKLLSTLWSIYSDYFKDFLEDISSPRKYQNILNWFYFQTTWQPELSVRIQATMHQN